MAFFNNLSAFEGKMYKKFLIFKIYCKSAEENEDNSCTYPFASMGNVRRDLYKLERKYGAHG